MKRFALLAIGVILAAGCAPRKEVIIVKEKPSEPVVEEKEEVSRDTTLPDTTTYFKFTPDTTGKTETTPQITQDESTSTSRTHGFRVQIFAFSSKDRAEKAKQEAQEVLSLPVYIEYDPSIDGPYKVRVGDFTSREEAERYKEKLRQEGYPDAFIVETEINK